jgi:predicted Zn-dependent protease
VNKSLIAVLSFTVMASSCTTSPTGKTQLQLVSESEMEKMGADAYEQLKEETPVTEDQQVTEYVNCVANAIAAELEGDTTWEVNVFDDDKQVNAFALPGGKIGVYTGLLKVAENQDQLASVIGHEVGHVLARHGSARYSANLASQLGLLVGAVALGESGSGNTGLAVAALGLGVQFGILLPYGRSHESEADEIGQDLMAKAGFDPRGSVALWQNMSAEGGSQPPEFLSTHPSHETRIDDLNAGMPRALQTYEQAQAQGKKPQCG